MALRPDNSLITNREMIFELLAAPLNALTRWIETIAESNARTQALRAIVEISDADLQAKGLTRAEAVALAFRHDA